MVMVLQSSMAELVNMSWAVVLVKSIGAAERAGKGKWRVIYTHYINGKRPLVGIVYQRNLPIF